MAKQVETVSMSFLDLLCSALGGVIFLMLVMSMTIRPGLSPPSDRYFVIELLPTDTKKWGGEGEFKLTLLPQQGPNFLRPIEIANVDGETMERQTVHANLGGCIIGQIADRQGTSRVIWSGYTQVFQLRVHLSSTDSQIAGVPLRVRITNTRGEIALLDASIEDGVWLSEPVEISF